jgi:hypothetical protein
MSIIRIGRDCVSSGHMQVRYAGMQELNFFNF